MLSCIPFEHAWKCEYSDKEYYGEGLLPKIHWEGHDKIESFSVRTPEGTISIIPSRGEILTDGNLRLKTESGKLIWYREMAFDFYTTDQNTRSSPRVNFYGLGIQNLSGRHGYKIYEDGKAVLGL